jgi:hypothetical protein
MIEFFTALIIYYQVQENTMSAVIWFDSYAKCEKVLRSEALHIIYEDKQNIHIVCDKTNYISKSIRPKTRPTNLENNK